MNSLVEVRHLSKFFPVTGGLMQRRIGAVKAVNDISFDIYKGESLGVVGESGCGKSTLARLILNLIRPTSGHVLYDGQDVNRISKTELRELRRKMQMVFQDPHSSLDPRISIYRSLEEVFTIQKEKLSRPKINERILELLGMVGLKPEHCRSYPHQLSGGQKQRAVIARALAMLPEFIILDEPTAALDVSVQAQIILLLQQLGDQFGITYLFISHDLALVDYFCQRIIVMYLGRIVEITPADLSRQKPMHPYTKVLKESVFVADPLAEPKAPRIEGDVPSPFNLPEGCVFETRCEYAQNICRKESPALRQTMPGRFVACHFPLIHAMEDPSCLPVDAK
ncbi:ABC transporter ATP-binding protein [Desulfopila sp. IMCC35006]|uniref:ABC transporter ATP-binding protein n=1 Tax=Desulfopila sp. IMCC35006 TaxID=2569542 RepID=UPI0010ABBF42|nr:ABC transporter ATP-binding protein [Desulfopila sp. IMCC35006]TKB28547.1 ABC transporter ATP-binding protein [Desulfopila sp. IMCC35006]